jgi:DNA-binding MarR family transcriptional regulator
MATGQLEDAIALILRRIARAVDRYSHRMHAQCGLTAPQLATLREVARRGQVSPGPLARAVHLSQPTVTGVLDRLVRQGLVARTRGDADRRTVWVEVTQKGQAVLESAPSLLQDRLVQELRNLDSHQQQTLVEALQCIADMMDPPETTTAPPAAIEGLLAAVSLAANPEGDPGHGAAAAVASPQERRTQTDTGGSVV